MPPKAKKQQAAQEDAEKDAIRVGPLVQWLIRDPATNPLVPCPSGRCYATGAIHDGRMYVFGGWNGKSRTEALKAMKVANLQLNRNMLNMAPPPIPTVAVPSVPLHVPMPPSSAPSGAKKKVASTDKSGSPSSAAGGGHSPVLGATLGSAAAATAVNGFFNTNSASAAASAADGGAHASSRLLVGNGAPIQSIPHPCHERDILCFDIITSAWSVVDSVLGEPHPGTSQGGIAELGGAVMLFGGWDGYRRHNTLTLFSQTEDRWKPYNTNADNTPPPLTFHAVCGYGRKLFVFGGEMAEGLNPDMYILDLTALNWSVAPSAGIPTKRTSHTMTVLQGLYVVVYGGRNADGLALSDVSIFDINSSHWIIGVKTNGVGPARYGHSAVAVTDKTILIYGGVGPKFSVGPNGALAMAPTGALNIGGSSAAGGGGGGSAKESAKASEKEKEAQQAAALVNAIGSYDVHNDVWLLTVGDKIGSVSWERCQMGTSLEPLAPAFRAGSPTRSVGSLGDASSAATPVPPDQHPANAANAQAASLNHSALGSRVTTPVPGAGSLSGSPLGAGGIPPPRCGHTAAIFGNAMYVYGGRTDSLGSVLKDISVLDITALLPPPASPTEGRDTRMDTDSMRAPSSALTA